MKTNTILKVLALVVVLTSACNKSEISNEKGYTLPVTVNVTRQGDDADATKATYNGSSRKLSFSTGDKLFVTGNDVSSGGAGKFAGTLMWVSGGTFSGTITTEKEYSGTADALFTAGGISTIATLLPDGYGDHNYLSIVANNGYDAVLTQTALNSIVTSKALAVEQLSLESGSYTSGTGFALAPLNAILNFTIGGLTPSKKVTATLADNVSFTISGEVTTDGAGNATFAMGIFTTWNLNDLSLTVGDNPITLVSSSKSLTAGKIYNISRTILHINNNAAVGKVIGANGTIYTNATAAIADNTTAVAMIAFLNGDHGLAIAMADENNGNWLLWNPAMTAAAAHTPKFSGCTWKIPTNEEWKQMFKPRSGYEGQYQYDVLNQAIYDAGGTRLKSNETYWTSTEGQNSTVFTMGFNADGINISHGSRSGKEVGGTCARSVLKF